MWLMDLCKCLIPKQHSSDNKKNLRKFLERSSLFRNMSYWHYNKKEPMYLISFPKTGRTWLTLMIGKALEIHFKLKNVNLLNLETLTDSIDGISKIELIHDDAPHWKKPNELKKTKDSYRSAKVIFLVRDPRDVIVSLYFEKKKRVVSYLQQEKKAYQGVFDDERIRPYEHNLSEYLLEEIGGFDTILEYYIIWAKNRHILGDFLLVRYEDLYSNPNKELRRTLDFLGLKSVNDEAIKEAVEYGAFNNMKKMEKEGRFNSHRLMPADGTDKESFKTRQGKVQGFMEYLNQDEIKFVNAKMGETLLDFFGYSAKA